MLFGCNHLRGCVARRPAVCLEFLLLVKRAKSEVDDLELVVIIE